VTSVGPSGLRGAGGSGSDGSVGIEHDIDADTDDFADIESPLLHDRTYRVRVYAEGPDRMRLRGMVRDRKPGGLYIDDDPEPLMVHHMVVDLVVSYPALEILEAKAVLETHPHHECPRIEDHYGNLVGLSIARGFTHRIRELFGGPRGCTHTTALLQAMAPAAIQATWSMRSFNNGGQPVAPPRTLTREERMAGLRFNIDTCHVWASDGPFVEQVLEGGEIPPPIWAERRMVELGRDPEEWRSRFQED
jgi:Protein of unknown function (DUF2889)